MALKDIPDSWLFRALRWLPKFVLVITVLLLLGMFYKFWVLELIVSFVPHALIIISGIYLVLFTLYARFIIRDGWHRCKTIVGGGDLGLLVSSVLMTLLVLQQSVIIVKPIRTELGSGPPLRIATYNKFIENEHITDAAGFLIQRNVDVLVMQETQEEEAAQMASILALPHMSGSDCDCSAEDSEIFIASKYPLSNGQSVFSHAIGGIHRAVMIHPEIGEVAVYGVHMPVPYTPNGYEQRTSAFASLTDRIELEALPSVVMGDFNTTVFSPDYKEFVRAMDGKLKPLLLRQWPRCTWHGFGQSTCLRIDHIFASNSANVQDVSIGDYTGSDHRPLLATVQFPLYVTQANLR